jgi:hypothetical protein
MTDLRQQLENAWTSAENPQSSEQENVAISEDNQEATAEPAEVISAPNSYKQEYKDSFNQLPTEWQKYLSSREKEVEQGLSRARNQYSWVDKAYNDRKDALAAQGYNNAQDYFNDLVLISDALNKDPTATIDLLKQNFGVNATGSQQDNALQRQLTALQEKVLQQQNFLQQQEAQRVKSELDAFVNAKDESGNLKHAYFEDVKEEMRKLFAAGLANTFDDAYNRAIWAVDSVREKMIAERAKNDMAQKQATAQKAKTAAFEPTGKTEGTPKKRSLREEIEHNMAIFGGE